MMYNCIGCQCQGVGSRGAAEVTSVGRVKGLPCPGSSQLHNAPNTEHTWAHWPNRWHLWENIVKEGGRMLDREEKEPKQCEHQGERRARRCSRCCCTWRGPRWSRYLHCNHGRSYSEAGGYAMRELWPMERPCWGRFILKDWSPWEGPKLEQGKSVRRHEWRIGAVLHWPQPHFPIPSPLLIRGR